MGNVCMPCTDICMQNTYIRKIKKGISKIKTDIESREQRTVVDDTSLSALRVFPVLLSTLLSLWRLNLVPPSRWTDALSLNCVPSYFAHFEIDSHYVAQATRKLTLYLRLAST